MVENMFSHKLNSAISAKNSRLCVGLDPRLEMLPKSIIEDAVAEHGTTNLAAAEAILAFNKQVIDVVAEYCVCIKPQSAFYEQFGAEGVRVFWETISYASSSGLVVIADVKRGDIDSTAAAYAKSYLGGVDVFGEVQTTEIDAITVNPFLGEDSLEPFFSTAEKNNKGVFVLVKTSNQGSADIQDLEVGGQSISERVATMLNRKDIELDAHGYSNYGAVVGATFPDEAKQFRAQLPHSIFLVPGIGAQGGDPTLLSNFFDTDGFGAVVSSSRGIVFSFDPDDETYLTRIKSAAQDTRDLINQHI